MYKPSNEFVNKESRFLLKLFHFLSDHECVCIVQDILWYWGFVSPAVTRSWGQQTGLGPRPVTRRGFPLALAGLVSAEPGHCTVCPLAHSAASLMSNLIINTNIRAVTGLVISAECSLIQRQWSHTMAEGSKHNTTVNLWEEALLYVYKCILQYKCVWW